MAIMCTSRAEVPAPAPSLLSNAYPHTHTDTDTGSGLGARNLGSSFRNRVPVQIQEMWSRVQAIRVQRGGSTVGGQGPGASG
eukprot:424371-Rhodomonas_salina.1